MLFRSSSLVLGRWLLVLVDVCFVGFACINLHVYIYTFDLKSFNFIVCEVTITRDVGPEGILRCCVGSLSILFVCGCMFCFVKQFIFTMQTRSLFICICFRCCNASEDPLLGLAIRV